MNLVLHPNNNHAGRLVADEKNLAINITKRFKRKEKFTSKVGEHVQNNLSSYEKACSAYTILRLNKCIVIQATLFDKEAKEYYSVTITSSSAS